MPSYTFLNLQTRVSAEVNESANQNATLAQVKAAIVSAVEHYERERKWFNETITRNVVTVAGAPAVAMPTDIVFLDEVQLVSTGTVTGDGGGTSTITNIADTSALQAGMFVTHALIPASTMIRSVAATSFTMMDVFGASVSASTSTGLIIRYSSGTTTSNLTEVPYAEFAGREWQIGGGEPSEYSYYQDRLWLWPKPNAVYSLRLSYVQRLTTLSADADNNGWTNYAEPVIRNRAKWDIFNNYLYVPSLAMEAKKQELDALVTLDYEHVQRNTTGKLKSRYL